mmetsp:Transcript_2438/g.10476  ORF Transcript_2438/g.10476 Transcript_2438/m.10476 type:complete len:319 (-) Transcript_2438:897-1853(-)
MGRRKVASAFPPARIKKIMQADEDVGKIATSTPVLVSKALELIIEDLMRKSAAIAEERSSKSITPQHLKECVTREESYDFLRETFSKVPELGPLQEKKPVKKTVKRDRSSVPSDPSLKKKRGRPPKTETEMKHSKDGMEASAKSLPKPSPSVPEVKDSGPIKEMSEETRQAAVARGLALAEGNAKAQEDDEEDYDDEEEEEEKEEKHAGEGNEEVISSGHVTSPLARTARFPKADAANDGTTVTAGSKDEPMDKLEPMVLDKRDSIGPEDRAEETRDSTAIDAEMREEEPSETEETGVTDSSNHTTNQKRISVQSLIM